MRLERDGEQIQIEAIATFPHNFWSTCEYLIHHNQRFLCSLGGHIGLSQIMLIVKFVNVIRF
jgi:hypothetical protein